MTMSLGYLLLRFIVPAKNNCYSVSVRTRTGVEMPNRQANHLGLHSATVSFSLSLPLARSPSTSLCPSFSFVDSSPSGCSDMNQRADSTNIFRSLQMRKFIRWRVPELLYTEPLEIFDSFVTIIFVTEKV